MLQREGNHESEEEEKKNSLFTPGVVHLDSSPCFELEKVAVGVIERSVRAIGAK